MAAATPPSASPPSVYDYASQPKVQRPTCLVCGSANPSTVVADRFGYAVPVATCGCTFRYLAEQLTPEGYAAFYAGPYRALIALHFPQVAKDVIWARGRFMAWLAEQTKRRDGVILNAGGGEDNTGIEAFAPSETILIDPACGGGSLEAFTLDRQVDGIVCAQTIDHCYDPIRALTNLRSVIVPGGWFVLDYVACDDQRVGPMVIPWRGVYKIDHPCYWTRPSLTAALERTGWYIERHWLARSPGVGSLKGVVVCRAS